MILLLPVVGAMVAWFYYRFGNDVQDGSNLILDEIHEPKKRVPVKIVPMIFIASTLSHLFGASVGREGAAVQMGAGLSDILSKFFHDKRKVFLMMGICGGFASIFGTPLAGTIFGMEILAIGYIAVDSLFPCLVASVSGYLVAYLLGLHHEGLPIIEIPPLQLSGMISAIIAGAFFGLAARLFTVSVHFVKKTFQEKIPNPILRPFIGGVILIIFFYATNSDRYLNLGEQVIRSTFSEHVYPWDFLGKISTTALSVGSGFKGGEVMPLFYIGATLGNTLAYFLWLSFPILAALGFVAVFAGAANTPITGIILAMEYFGSGIGVYAALAVATSYLFSGSTGIYSSQRGKK
jgi:H+/Cl- antiporter ClcA